MSVAAAAPARGGRIVVDRLSKSFARTRAVDDLSFTVEPGSVTGFLGPNGAGKTTTLRMILGLARSDSGTATISGRRYADLPQPARAVGAVLEATSFHPGRTARNHLRIYCAAAGLPDSRADEVLASVGLSDVAGKTVHGFSLGMRQRLGLATALLGDPGVLILDEPANGLDPEGIQWLRNFMRWMASSRGCTVLVSSHLLAEVEQTVDRVVIIARGRLVREGTLEELRAGHGELVRVRTPTPDALVRALTPLRATASPADDGTLRVSGASLAAVGHAAWAAQVELHELSAAESNLQEIFLQLTGDVGGVAHAATAPWAESR
ncbi:MAG: ABC transporter ATP-binding protein [Candidatus Dormibacteria bacterium]